MSNPFEIDPVPILPTSFVTLVNKRVPGVPQHRSQTYTVGSDATIRLIEAPAQANPSTVLISGYLETTNPNPSSTQFLVNYTNGIVTFNASQVGAIVVVSYYGNGSVIVASDVNNVEAAFSQLLQRETQTATALQAAFNVSRFTVAGTSTLIFVNGLLQDPTSNYTFTGPSQVTFVSGLPLGTLVTFVKIGA